MFTKDDEIFKHLKSGDVISVWVSAGPKHRNHAGSGYLVFGFGNGPKTYKTPKLRGSTDDAPLISVYAQKRQECLTIPVDGLSSVIKANVVKGGIALMDRLLKTEDNDWKVDCHIIPDDLASWDSPDFDSVTELAEAKHGHSPRIAKQSTIKKLKRELKISNSDNNAPPAKIIVLDDFEVNKGNDGGVVLDPCAEVVVYQMHAPLWSGTLWNKVLANANQQIIANTLKRLGGATQEILLGRLQGSAPTEPRVLTNEERNALAGAGVEPITADEHQALAEVEQQVRADAQWKALEEKDPPMEEIDTEAKLEALTKVKLEALVGVTRQGLSTIVVIDADDLRADGIRISRGISWEKTMEDFHTQIERINDKIKGAQKDGEKDRVLDIMKRGVHLLVRCGYEGVLHLRPSLDLKPRPFVFHMVPNVAEGELLRPYRGQMLGIHLAFIAGLAASLARHPKTRSGKMGRTQIGTAIELAIVWSYRFVSSGFCKDRDGFNYPQAKDVNNYQTSKTKVIYGDQDKMGEQYKIGYKLVDQEAVDQEAVDQEAVDQEAVDQEATAKEKGWSLFSLLEQKRHPVAAEVVKLGTNRLEASIPTARFGSVQTADRTEIEGYRSTAAVIHEYLSSKVKKPLSIAVFGQPGAGKSFGVKEVIKAVLNKDKDWEPIEANLSQFLQYSDLVRVFDKVRDTSLKGETPVVLFDEFDSVFNGPLGWLKYFLAPMQDGEFLDSGFVRPLGRAIFIFIGGTSSTFSEFKYGTEKKAREMGVAESVARIKVAAEKQAVKEAAANEAEAVAKEKEAVAKEKEAEAAAKTAIEAGKAAEAATGERKTAKEAEAVTKKNEAEAAAKTAIDAREAAETATKARKAAEAATGKRKTAEEHIRNLAAKILTNDDKKAKKPDFVSRLSAHINVKGPNESDDDDVMFVMRRAMLLQGQLRKHFKVDPKDIHVDETVLNALLKHKHFPNGTRSIELILQSSTISGGRRFESSDLPSAEQLSMHVGDVVAFHALIDEPIEMAAVRPVDIDLYNKLMWARLEKDID
ncbi:hypothetical protein LCI18_012725 [Fusarium solani-melongenae]|uniref:Uncharacterized protein n=1 Tax=Fusarium solani subsp. cucurbitae TaxID=2747967 RepID=A0ACD3ZKQ0_FUSSC|nr:hypothetical protein LCI18_012725 [Fusarium solani-melongenae]